MNTFIDIAKLKRAYMMSVRNQSSFKKIDENKGVDTLEDSSKYLQSQADDLVNCFDKWLESKDETYLLFARTELERILALAMRLCIANQWNFSQLIVDGCEYEEQVLLEIEKGKRKRDTAKWATGIKY